MMLKKRFVAIVVAAVLCFSMAFVVTGCSGSTTSSGSGDSATTITVTDSLGRQVEIPKDLAKISPAGPPAMQVLATIAPEMICSISKGNISDTDVKYFPALADLKENCPVTGSLYGAEGDINYESITATGTQLAVDTGEIKGSKEDMIKDLDTFTEKTGIPIIFVETTLENYDEAYTLLGQALGKEERGKELADYCKSAYDEVAEVMESIPADQRTNILYCLGDTGTNIIPAGCGNQAWVIEMVANTVTLEGAHNKGTGNQVNMESIVGWNPEVILFESNTIYDTVASDATWSTLDAVKSGRYYEVPNIPYTWLNNPPSVNQVMGLQWLPRLLYGDKFDTSIEDVTKSYYKTFYDYDISDEELNELIKNSVSK